MSNTQQRLLAEVVRGMAASAACKQLAQPWSLKLVAPLARFQHSSRREVARNISKSFRSLQAYFPSVRDGSDKTLCTISANGADTVVEMPSVDGSQDSTRSAAQLAGPGANLLAYYCDHYVVTLPEGHRFPMDKIDIKDASIYIRQCGRAKRILWYMDTRGILAQDASLRGILDFHPSPMASLEELTMVHDQEYVQCVMTGSLGEKEQRATGFPWSPALVQRSQASTGGTIAAMYSVMEGGRHVSGHIAGGTHHGFAGHGEGFCVFNDIAAAAKVALEEYPERCNLNTPILVVDLDVHQGNGTAKIFEGDDRVITFSMHGANNYPWRTKMRSNYDVELDDGTEDANYLTLVQQWLPKLFHDHQPGLVFFQSGVDALKEDSFGRLSLTRQGLLKRNNLVYTMCLDGKVPLVITMGGGYSRPIISSVLAHADVYRSAAFRYNARYGVRQLGSSSSGSLS